MICGLAAIGKVYVEALIIAYGDGRNGKSTFWNVISRVLGLYSGNISADTLTVGLSLIHISCEQITGTFLDLAVGKI